MRTRYCFFCMKYFILNWRDWYCLLRDVFTGKGTSLVICYDCLPKAKGASYSIPVIRSQEWGNRVVTMKLVKHD